MGRIRVGTAGWGLPRPWREAFPAGGSNLARYAGRCSAVEINSSFYRPHRRAVYERWAAAVPPDFRFAVKLPRAITHDQRLVAADVLLDVFLDEARGLGEHFGPLLVQLPPSLALDIQSADEFLRALRGRFDGDVAWEPRHATWFGAEGEALLRAHRVARVAADPALGPGAGSPGGWTGLTYLRLHGSPRPYFSEYGTGALARYAAVLRERHAAGSSCWCIFDNTTLGAATGNALALAAMLEDAPAATTE